MVINPLLACYNVYNTRGADAGGAASRKASGSRAGSTAAVEALHSFSLIVCATLGDAQANARMEPAAASAELSASDALSALQQMALQQQSPSQPAANPQTGMYKHCLLTLLHRALQLQPKCVCKVSDTNTG